jgi:hypothetical protein
MTTNLQPTICSNEDEIVETALDGIRVRPVVAINENGESIVCCARTARKHGWTIEGTMFKRSAVSAPKPPKATKTQRQADLDAVEELLGKK